MVMLVIMICVSLSALMIPTFLAENVATRRDSSRTHALNAAETGLQVGLGSVRAAKDDLDRGMDTKLPCGTQLVGTVTGENSRYRVSMSYFDTDPRGHDTTWRGANQISCGALPTHTPSFVGLNSTGTDHAFSGNGDRTLDATYVIRTNNQNIPGGLIQNYYDGAASYINLCMDAGSATPAAGTPLTMQQCQYNVPDQQKFSYRNNLSLLLNSSLTTTGPGMCLQPDDNGSIVFQPCISAGSDLYKQQWSFNDGAQFQSAASTGGGLSTSPSQCLNIQTLDFVGSNVVLGGCSGLPGRQLNWLPSPAAGAGMAGPNTDQVINFKQFGRCLDLQEWTLSNPLIAWPCKQTPDGTPGWNQRWVYNSTTKTLSLDVGPAANASSKGNPAISYCARAPLTTATGADLRVMVSPCPDPSGVTDASLQWTSHRSASDTYRDKYTYVDFTGTRCLQPSSTDFYRTSGNSSNSANNTSFVVAAPCDGSLLQKWNGDPNVLLGSPLRDANER